MFLVPLLVFKGQGQIVKEGLHICPSLNEMLR
jgi:hypothetical protein